MQDLNKIENEHLQANDVGDDAQTGLTREFAKEFALALESRISSLVIDFIEETGMDNYLNKHQIFSCAHIVAAAASDGIGDMPIWDIVKRAEA